MTLLIPGGEGFFEQKKNFYAGNVKDIILYMYKVSNFIFSLQFDSWQLM